ncbi:MAG: glycosyl hydrolase family 95 catalytic domain-containing protein [Candidatus Scalindua sp.]
MLINKLNTNMIIIRYVLFRLFLVLSVSANAQFSSFEKAKEHPVVHEGPAPDFFEGALIGNGGLGAVVCSRPDAIVIRFGHNNVWDIRIAENNQEEIGTFQEVFEKIRKIDPSLKSLNEDPWYKEYLAICQENYNKTYPRPFPCGSLILGFDRRKVEVINSKLDISQGLVTIKLLLDQNNYADLLVFADMKTDRVWMKLVDENGVNLDNCFNRIRLLPDQETPSDFPEYTTQVMDRAMAFRQVLPALEPAEYDKEKGHQADESFCLNVVTSATLENKQKINYGQMVQMTELEYGFKEKRPFWLCIDLNEGLSSNTKPDLNELNELSIKDYSIAYASTLNIWKDYWAKSGVLLEDKFLEEVWYRNIYFFNCATKSGVKPPGLFANWSFGNIGTAWHGDYHLDYNAQQPYLVTFSSNHLDKNLAYIEEIELISEVAKLTAEDYYQMRGAIYPVSAYPVKMTMSPYLRPTWGWQISTTPWAVQGVWWHYLYSGDLGYLESRAFPLIKDVVLFIVDYMTRLEAHGEQWNDDKYHIFPTVPPELYGLMPGFKFNSDGLADLTFIKRLFHSYMKSVELLEIQKQEKQILRDIKKILANYPDYPTAESEEYGEVFVSVEGESPEMVYNVPVNLFSVFPGEEHGLHSDEEIMELLLNTKRNSQNEGGNELVFQHLQAARIGMLDLEVFKREIKYNLLPNGTCTLNTLQTGGRYSDNTDPYHMARMGIWFENFALPVVINECMMQSYNGIIRLFPNWPKSKEAEFQTLRATGGFLVGSRYKEGMVGNLQIESEKGGTLRFYSPWDENVEVLLNGESIMHNSEVLEFETTQGQQLIFQIK